MRKQESRQLKLPVLFAYFLMLLIGFVLCAGLFSKYLRFPAERFTLIGKEPPISTPVLPEPEPEPEPPQPIIETVHFSATGDNLIHSPIYKQAERQASGEEKYNFAPCYEEIELFYAQQDVNWLNQETLCSDELTPSTYPAFTTPGDCARALYRAGIRVFSLSNNHTYDRGAKGIASTLRFWDSMPEDVVTTGLWKGEEDYSRIPTHTVNGITIAYLSYTEHTNGIPQSSSMTANVIYTSQTDVIETQVRAARKEADFVVVGVHWGVEDSHTIVDSQRQLAQKLADWGADVIVGTHPHVLQNAQWLTAEDGRESFVAYSLGNFISTQNRPDQLTGAILSLQLRKTTDPDGTIHCEVQNPKLHPTVTHYNAGKNGAKTYFLKDYTPELAKKHGARANHPEFSVESIQRIVHENISSEFLELS